jgi:two-component system sensor histidine kinase HydH
MMAIGQVAAGVAHELRNPLTSIKGLVQVNIREAVARGLPAEDLAVIEHEIRRMERTLQTFLDFARPPKPDRKPLDLRNVIDRVFSLIGGRARKQDVALRVIGESLTIAGDQDQLQQLLLNLFLNALDAMPDGGTIEVETALRGGYAEVVVRDSGPGIPGDVLPKVFETFVSSKETGVGLGLPVSLRIAEDHGGTLNAYNLPGGGACFVLQLPAQSA